MKIKHLNNRIAQVFWNGDNSLQFKNFRYLPRWIVVAIDLVLVLCSCYFSLFLIENGNSTFYEVLSINQQVAFLLLVYLATFFTFSTYSGLIRHSTFVDVFKIVMACSLAMLFLVAINFTYYFLYGQKVFLMSFLIVHLSITFTALFLLGWP